MSSGTKLTIYNNYLSSSDYIAFFIGLTSTQLDEVISSDFDTIWKHIFNSSHPLATKVRAGFSKLKDLRNTGIIEEVGFEPDYWMNTEDPISAVKEFINEQETLNS